MRGLMFITLDQTINVKAFMKKHKITLKDIGWKLNISFCTVSVYLNGRQQLPEKHWAKLSEIFPLNKIELKKGNFVFKKSWK